MWYYARCISVIRDTLLINFISKTYFLRRDAMLCVSKTSEVRLLPSPTTKDTRPTRRKYINPKDNDATLFLRGKTVNEENYNFVKASLGDI